ncbi:unnamed protein product [Microthlaspi erraticum]|uniref:Ubiquitin-like protease family profile domain-containing protein n=1 Tax=Microthlaspi erraticum TaxID=1685480 RepID=A0A6D2IN61_9BRAS|nr:unnamed protein product [Microthlaspi erraticum]CAA7044166.1 unnamed protein product [Microthlaspi erraticum]
MYLDRFHDYPWCRVAFKHLMTAVKGVDLDKSGFAMDGFVEVLQVWAYHCMPEFARKYGAPLPSNPTPPVLAYKGVKGRRYIAEAMLKQVNFNNWTAVEDRTQVYPRWDDVVDDGDVDNIVKALHGELGGRWRWKMTDWIEAGVLVARHPRVEESKSQRGITETESVSQKRHCPWSPSLGQGIEESLQSSPTPSLVSSKWGFRSTTGSSHRPRSSVLQKSPFLGNITVKVIITKKPRVTAQPYNPFAVEDKQVRKELNAFLKSTPGYPKNDKDLYPLRYWWWELITQPQWLSDSQVDAAINVLRLRMHEHPEWFRSERICLVDSGLSLFRPSKYEMFMKSEPNVWGLGKFLPPDSMDYYYGKKPEYCQSLKRWGRDVDDIYIPLNVDQTHWIALMVSIPNRHIVVWDSLPSCIGDPDLETK